MQSRNGLARIVNTLLVAASVSSCGTTVRSDVEAQGSAPPAPETALQVKGNEMQRRGVTSALPPATAQAHVAELAAVLTSKGISYGIASDAAEALGRAGNAAALDALRSVAGAGDSQAADLALRAMARNEDSGWRNAVIEVASSATSKSRAKALYNLGLFEVKAGGDAMREAASSNDVEVRKAACAALERLKEAAPAACGAAK